MPITVVIPNALRPFAGGNDRVPLEAKTVAEAIQKLVERYPDLTNRLPDLALPAAGSGIFRGGSNVRRLQGAATMLEPNDIITVIVPAGDL